MSRSVMSIVSSLYNTDAKKKALFRDLKMYLNSKANYRDHRDNILQSYLESLKVELIRLNRQYKGIDKNGMMEDFMELSLHIEVLESLLGFEGELYKHLERKTKAKNDDTDSEHDPYS